MQKAVCGEKKRTKVVVSSLVLPVEKYDEEYKN